MYIFKEKYCDVNATDIIMIITIQVVETQSSLLLSMAKPFLIQVFDTQSIEESFVQCYYKSNAKLKKRIQFYYK